MTVKNDAGWIDVTVPLTAGMVVWPNDIPAVIERRVDMNKGGMVNNSFIHMGVHTGTHMDAPLHFIAKGKSIDQLPFDACVGPARIIEIKDKVSIKAEELKQYNIQRGERILFKTHNSPAAWKNKDFAGDFVFITKGAAQLLADSGVKLVGVDYLSVGSPNDPDKGMKDVHDILLGAEIWLIEGLDLTKTTAGNVNLICLPLRLMNTEGSPVRAIVQPIK